MSNSIGFFEITCRDAAPLAKFYRDMFGWDVVAHGDEKYAMVNTGDASSLSGIISEIPDNVPAAMTVFVSVASVDDALARVGDHGGQVLFPPMQLPSGQTVAMIMDPAGLAIGLMQTA